jgi:hypothetical protein
MAQTVQKNVTLPKQLFNDLALKAGKVGLSISEYIRILVFNDTKSERDEIVTLPKRLEESVSKGYEDIRKGNYITLKTKEDIKNYIDSI